MRILKDLPAFSDDLASAMAPAFHRVDNLLEDPSNLKELKALKASPKASEEEGGSDDTGRDGAGESGKKIKVEEVQKRRSRRTTKFQRAIVGASLDEIKKKRSQKPAGTSFYVLKE